MPMFKGFRASLNFATGKNISSDYSENVSTLSVSGAYRVNREEFFGTGSYVAETPKKITPAMVKLPSAFQPDPTDPDVNKISKSTGDLTQTLNLNPDLSKSTPNVSMDPRGGMSNKRKSTDIRQTNSNGAKSQIKEQKKLEKKLLVEQKAREKLAAQEQAKEEKLRKEREKIERQEKAKQEKLRKEREKVEAQAQAKEEKLRMEREKAEARQQSNRSKPKKEKSKNKAVKSPANPLARGAGPSQPESKVPKPPPQPAPSTTNTLNSSISKSSGPPPYSEVTQPLEVVNPNVVQNESDNTGNTSFSKPIESADTWDLIAQHRQQLSKAPVKEKRNQMVVQLQQVDNNPVAGRKSVYI